MSAEPTDRTTELAVQLAEALVRLREGDQSAAGELVRLATPLLWHVARSCRLDAASAEDAVQNTMLALVRHQESISEPRAVLRWLVVTVRREAIAMGRTASRVQPAPDAGDQIAAPRSSQPEESAVVGETRACLWAAIGRLSERCRQLLRIIAFADRPDYGAIALALDMPVGSIGPTRGRCLAKLRAELAADPCWGR